MAAVKQTVEIVVTGVLSFPSINSPDLQGKKVEIDLTNAVITGYAASVGNVPNDAHKARNRDDVIRLAITAESVNVVELPEV